MMMALSILTQTLSWQDWSCSLRLASATLYDRDSRYCIQTRCDRYADLACMQTRKCRISALDNPLQQSQLTCAAATMQVKDYAAELVEPNHAPLSAILRPEDEIQLWSDLAQSSTCPAALQLRAAEISRIFAPVIPKLQNLRKVSEALPEEAILDLIDDMQQSLEALWELEAEAPGQYPLTCLIH